LRVGEIRNGVERQVPHGPERADQRGRSEPQQQEAGAGAEIADALEQRAGSEHQREEAFACSEFDEALDHCGAASPAPEVPWAADSSPADRRPAENVAMAARKRDSEWMRKFAEVTELS